MSAPDLIPLVVEHLKKIAELRKNVAGAIELEAAIENPKFVAPYFYALRFGEVASPSDNITVVQQRVVLTFGVVYAVPNTTRGTGIMASGAPDDLRQYRDPVINAVLGWQAAPEYDPITFRRGRLIQVQSKVLWWQDEFETAFYIRQK